MLSHQPLKGIGKTLDKLKPTQSHALTGAFCAVFFVLKISDFIREKNYSNATIFINLFI